MFCWTTEGEYRVLPPFNPNPSLCLLLAPFKGVVSSYESFSAALNISYFYALVSLDAELKSVVWDYCLQKGTVLI
jgi:hypothetical protein